MKYHGKLGFVLTEETSPGTWTPRLEVREVSGDILQRTVRESDSQSINSNVDISQQISIVYDNFITQNMFVLEWVEWMGRKWKVSRIDLRPPRMNITLGDRYIEEGDDD